MAKILVTGATGFIGKRLVFRLLNEGHEVYALSRIGGVSLPVQDSSKFHLLFGDLKDPTKILDFPKDIEAAYYLVHSMGSIVQDLANLEVEVASNFLRLIEKTNCKQIIFLSGIIENESSLSSHLRSRLSVENTLKKSPIPCTILRSSIIIGSGSASFEIIRDLVEKLPMMVAPRWVKSYCQPIAVRDVLFYLSEVLLNPSCYHQTFDIGGPEAISFEDILKRYARFKKLRRIIFNIPVLTPKLSSYWLVFITTVRFSLCKYLIESMRQNTRKVNKKIDTLIPHDCLTYEQALAIASENIDKNEVKSTWMDSWEINRLSPSIDDFIRPPQQHCFKDIQNIPITLSIDEVKKRIWSIGGDQGWYSMNWAWKLRGIIDQTLGGTGFNRGRRHPSEIEVGDSIDFWRVVIANRARGHLALYAEMKLPGQAWLEFEISQNGLQLQQTATFKPEGLLGKIYWYCSYPFHLVIFRKMAKTIAQGETQSHRNSWKSLIVFLLISFVIEMLGSFLTRTSVNSWYLTLEKASWNPPSWVFAPVWTILYIMISVSGWLIFCSPQSKQRIKALNLYSIQFGLNLLWSFSFFFLMSPALGLLNIVALNLSVIGTITLFWPISQLASLLLIPYLFWIFYAFTLNAAIWWLN